MTCSPEMRSPAPCANAGNRAEVEFRNDFTSTTVNAEPEACYAALYIARRYCLSPSFARAVAILARLGRAFG
jgi:hypothetical protein